MHFSLLADATHRVLCNHCQKIRMKWEEKVAEKQCCSDGEGKEKTGIKERLYVQLVL